MICCVHYQVVALCHSDMPQLSGLDEGKGSEAHDKSVSKIFSLEQADVALVQERKIRMWNVAFQLILAPL